MPQANGSGASKSKLSIPFITIETSTMPSDIIIPVIGAKITKIYTRINCCPALDELLGLPKPDAFNGRSGQGGN